MLSETAPLFASQSALISLLWGTKLTLRSGSALEMKKGHISLTPYNVVENLLARGEVELV